MIDIIIAVGSRWKPFTVVIFFFLVGFGDRKAFDLFCNGDLRNSTIGLVGLLNVVALGYFMWLSRCPSFYIQPRTRAILVALAMFLGGVVAGGFADGMIIVDAPH